MVHSLLAHKDKTFQVRVITRDPTSEKARKIARLGAHLIQADGLNQEQITRALQGSWGLFINSNSDDHVNSRPRNLLSCEQYIWFANLAVHLLWF